jgi:transcription termination factor Rho
MKERYESILLTDLRQMAKNRGVKNVTEYKKDELVQVMLELDAQDARAKAGAETEEKKKAKAAAYAAKKPAKDSSKSEEAAKEGTKAESTKEGEDQNASEYPAELDSGIVASGILEVMADGFGFIRCDNFLPGDNDVYVANGQIRRFNLRTGDIIEGHLKVKTSEK